MHKQAATYAALIAAMVTSAMSATLSAQPAAVSIGDQVRFKATPVHASADTSTVRCEGHVSRLLLDTLVVRPEGYCGSLTLSLLRVSDFEIERKRGSRAVHVAIGAGLGILGGGVAGLAIAGDGCKRGGCDDGGLAAMSLGIVSAAAGGLIGTIIGFVMPAGNWWEQSPDREIRIDQR
jgi:hypothetical protein